LIIHTVMHLRWTQIAYQLRYRLHRAKYAEVAVPKDVETCHWITPPIARPKSWNAEERTFTFLNITDTFKSWDNTSHGSLWAYNQNYMDWLSQSGMTAEEGAEWIDRFICDTPYNNIGFDPYPTALRGINWIKFISQHREEIDKTRIDRWNGSLYSQYVLLTKRLEYHLLGNHLLEDAYSLCIGTIYFGDKRMWREFFSLLKRQLCEQILADGAHYEQSPMYHCILLDRLLDVYNFSTSNPRFGQEQNELNAFLRRKAVDMLGHLENITYQDGSFPIFNDAAEGIAPTPEELKAYARRLGLAWKALPLRECGYRHLKAGAFETFVDVGGMAASYQPGHSHADALNYELRIDGKPFVVDTGISTYDKNPRRQYERSTEAHNTVTIDGQDSAEVWGGFRVGKRCEVSVVEDLPDGVVAQCNCAKKGNWHSREFNIDDNSFFVYDSITDGVEGISRMHLAQGIKARKLSDTEIYTDMATIRVSDAARVEVEDCDTSTEYNRLMKSAVIEIHFTGSCQYEIIRNKQ